MRKIILLTTFIAIVSCSTKQNTTKTVAETKSEIALSPEIAQGKSLYANSCAQCHELISPKQYNETEWHEKLDWMQERAKINDTEKALIYGYLVSVK